MRQVFALLLVILMSRLSSKAQAKEFSLTPTDDIPLTDFARNRYSVRMHFFRYSSSKTASDDKRLVPTGSNPLHNRNGPIPLTVDGLGPFLQKNDHFKTWD
ncbi:hypothetical protein OROGR_006506 [Orobanche gracilis]